MWSRDLQRTHINNLEPLAGFLALKHFLTFHHLSCVSEDDMDMDIRWRISLPGGFYIPVSYTHRLIFWSNARVSEMVTFRPRGSGLVRTEGERTVPSVFFPSRPERTTGSRCFCERVATYSTLGISPSGFDSSDIVQGAGEPSVTDLNCSSPAIHALAGGSGAGPPRPPMAPPAVLGPSLEQLTLWVV